MTDRQRIVYVTEHKKVVPKAFARSLQYADLARETLSFPEEFPSVSRQDENNLVVDVRMIGSRRFDPAGRLIGFGIEICGRRGFR